MFTVLHFHTIMDAILFYLIIGIIIGIPAFYFYRKSVESRKVYKCTHCGEIYRTEHMKSSCCKVCGAPTEEIKDIGIDE